MAGLLSAAQLAAFRAVASSALDISGVVIQRNTPVSNGDGTSHDSWATIATVAASQAKPAAGIMAAYSDVIGSAASYVIRLPYGTSYHANDRLVMPDGDVLRIQADLSDSSYSTAMLLLAVRIQP
jgi:hypothetical protein